MPKRKDVSHETGRQPAKPAKRPDLTAQAIGRRLRSLRLAREAASGADVVFKAIGSQLKVTGAAVGKWEKGRGRPTLENLEGLARYWGVHPGWLAFGWEPRTGQGPTRDGAIRDASDEELIRIARGLPGLAGPEAKQG